LSTSPSTQQPVSILKFRIIAAAALFSVAGAIFAIGEAAAPGPAAVPVPLIRLSATEVTNPVQVIIPRNFSGTLPHDLASWPVAGRKKAFVQVVLPLVLRENEQILANRRQIQKLAAVRSAGRRLSDTDRDWLLGMAERYHVGTTGSALDVEELIRRVDMVPPSLAIAQAAVESGWGTSRFARLGNALFGQWTFKVGAGIVPLGRSKGATYEVKAYDALSDSVRDYVKNLNTHRAYRGLRHLRATLRQGGGEPAGPALSATLVHYSTQGEDYVRSLQSIIRVNNLARFDGARLDNQRLAALDLN
jgi:Bax protein